MQLLRPCLNIFNIAFIYFGGFFSQRDCKFLHFLTDTTAPHRPAEVLCSKPQSAVSEHCDTEVPSVACPEFLYSVLKRTWDVALNWPFSGDGPESKDCKNMKALAFCGAYGKLCTILVTSRERGCWTTKTASSNCSLNSWSKLVKERMRLVLGVQLPRSGDRSFNDREWNYCLPRAVCITGYEAANCYNLIYCICNFLSNMRSCYLFLSWPVLLTFYHGRWFQRSNKTLPT